MSLVVAVVDSVRCVGVEALLGRVGAIVDCADLESSFSMVARGAA